MKWVTRERPKIDRIACPIRIPSLESSPCVARKDVPFRLARHISC